MRTSTTRKVYTSYGQGTEQDIYVYSLLKPGRFEITLYVEDFSDVSIVAEWYEYDIPGPNPEPEPEPEPKDIYMCDEDFKDLIEEYDVNGDGLLNTLLIPTFQVLRIPHSLMLIPTKME